MGKTGILFIHGFTGTPWVFREIEEKIKPKKFLISAPLLPGHGTQPEDLISVSWKEWVACAKKHFYELAPQCEKVFIVGLSMGGAIALLLGTEVPCHGVISISAPFRFRKPWVLVMPVMRLFVRYWKKSLRSNENHTPEEIGYDRYPLSGLRQLLLLLKNLRMQICKIRVPVLVIHGRRDKKVPVQNAKWIYGAVPGNQKELVILDSNHHVITKGETAARVTELILNFIEKYSFQEMAIIREKY